MYEEGAQLIPAVRARAVPRRVVGGPAADRLARTPTRGRELSRTFKTFDHAETDGRRGLRHDHRRQGAPRCAAWPSCCADVVCRKLGDRRAVPHARHGPAPHTAYYAAEAPA